MFSVGDRVVIQKCSVGRWIGMAGIVIDPAYGRGRDLTSSQLWNYIIIGIN
jgi:hypothetical protein